MNSLADVQRLIDCGRFNDALVALRLSNQTAPSRSSAEVVRAFLLERVGQHSHARRLAERLIAHQDNSAAARSLLEQTLGTIEIEAGSLRSARVYLQRAVSLARQSSDPSRLWAAQLRFWTFVCDDEGADAAAPLLRELRDTTLRAANPVFTAGLHVYVGEFEAKRGLIGSARWHTRIALKILHKSENVWLEATAENTLLAIALMRSDYRAALSHGIRAVKLAEDSGVAVTLRAALGNFGNAFLLHGEYAEAKQHLEQARTIVGVCGENASANADSLARIALAEGDLDSCRQILERIEAAIQRPDDRALFAYRYSRLTRAQLHLRCGQLPSALDAIDDTIRLAQAAGDRRLLALASAVRGETLVALHSPESAIEQAKALADMFWQSDVDVYGHYLRLCALACAATNDQAGALRHYLSAKRLYNNIGDLRGLAELRAAVQQMVPELNSASSSGSPEVERSRDLLTNVAAMLLFPDRFEVVSSELERLLRAADAIVPGSFQWCDVSKELLVDTPIQTPASVTRHTVRLGDRTIEIRVIPRDGIGPASAVNAALAVLDATTAVAKQRDSLDAEAAIWPTDNADVDAESTVALGHMSELLTVCSRVARAKVTVLITGESGTGKEILARAIHGFSPRAAKPFLPFNCTAVPRDLIEGQLFGHRRGAFTGADRDHAGIVRTAIGGTLFLDEIGELGLDLQPKLLRFLESGEILPLGDTQPVRADVRVIAATNRDLAQLVADGTFREDLYYRLNVVHLPVPPLRDRRDEIPALAQHFVRQAAQEYEKGDVRISPDTMEYLLLFRWPGNIRQLANELRRIVVMAERNSTIEPEQLSAFITTGTIKPAPPGVQAPLPTEVVVRMDQPLARATEHLERAMLAYALRQAGGHLDGAASLLGVSRKGLYLKRQRLGLS